MTGYDANKAANRGLDHASPPGQSDTTDQKGQYPYQRPALIYYGGLDELVPGNPGVHSDGGSLDYSHL